MRDVGEDSQEDDEVSHQEAGIDGEVSQFNDALNCEVFHQNHGVVFHQDGGSEDEVEVFSRQSFHRKSTTSISAQSSSSSQSSTRRRSKAVIEIGDDDEETQPAENPLRVLSPPNVDILLSKSVAGADYEVAKNSEVICQEPIETMIFTNSILHPISLLPSHNIIGVRQV